MNAPLIWIILPGVVSSGLWLIRRNRILTSILAAAFCLFLSMTAWLIPIEKALKVGAFSVEINSTLSILGRQFSLIPQDGTFLALIYLFGMFWFLGAAFVDVSPAFTPLGVMVISLSVGALSVEPFLYAALLIEIAVLLTVPMLIAPHKPVGQGVLRYVIFQTLAVPFILLAGWAANQVDINPSDSSLLLEAVVFLGLGFAFWLAAFPFYTWVPLLSEEGNSYTVGFILSLLSTVTLFLSLDFFNTYTWLRTYSNLPMLLRDLGVIMIVTSGLWAAFQKDLTRLFGYAVIIENGYAILALSLGSQVGVEVFITSFLSRLVAFALWSLGLALIRQKTNPDFEGIAGLLRRLPIACTAVIVACFSIAGLPLLAAFPIRQVLWENLAGQSLGIAFGVGLGSAGLFLGGFRALIAMVQGDQFVWKVNEKWPQALLLLNGMAVLFFMGIVPSWFIPAVLNMLQAYEHLH